jgi:hypothetical protein
MPPPLLYSKLQKTLGFCLLLCTGKKVFREKKPRKNIDAIVDKLGQEWFSYVMVLERKQQNV